MNIPSQDSAPTQTFQTTNNISSPAAFRQHLLHVIEVDLADGAQIKASDKGAWITVVTGFSEHLLAGFPSPSVTPWNVLHEKASLIDLALEIFLRVLNKVEGLFDDHAELALDITQRLVSLCVALGQHEGRTFEAGNGFPSPEHLRSKTLDVIVKALSCLGEDVRSTSSQMGRGWTSLRRFLGHCLVVCETIFSQRDAFFYPSTAALLEDPGIRPIVEDIGEQANLPAGAIAINNEHDVAELLSVLIQICCLTVRATRAAFFLCFSSSWHGVSSTCLRHLCRALSSLQSLTQSHPNSVFEQTCAYMTLQLVLHCIQSSPLALGDALYSIIERPVPPSSYVPQKAYCQTVVQAFLRATRKEEANVDVAAKYLRHFVRYCEKNILLDIQSAFSAQSSSTSQTLMGEVQARLAELSAAAGERKIEDHMAAGARQVPLQLEKVIARIQTIVRTDQDSPTDDMAELKEDDLVAHVLWMIHNGLPGFMEGLSFNEKTSALKALAELPCLLMNCNNGICRRLTRPDHLTLGGVYSDIVLRLFTSQRRPDTSIRKLAFAAFARALRHQPIHVASSIFPNIENKAREDIGDKSRELRIAAGRVLVESICIYDRLGKEEWGRIDPSFNAFYGILNGETETIKETVLVTVGAIGRVTSADILYAAINCLVSQLASPNPVLKGLAYTQILDLAKHFKKKPYRLISPYMDRIAPALIRRYATHRSMLVEFCRLVRLQTATFIRFNLPSTLPVLFATRDRLTLERLSELLQERTTSLCLKNAEHILSHILLMRDQQQADDALDFVMEILVGPSEGTPQIDIPSLIKSCVVPLLASLVAHLGHPQKDEAIAARARDALFKVERILSADKREKKRQRSGDTPSLEMFLREYLLGIILHMTDILQDITRKKPPEFKCQVLRGIGKLSELLGSETSSIAPQIITALQMSLNVPELVDAALESWATLLRTLGPSHVGPHVGSTSAAIVWNWQRLSATARGHARECLYHFVVTLGAKGLGDHLDDVVDLSDLEGLNDVYKILAKHRSSFSKDRRLGTMLNRASSDNMLVVYFALRELKAYMIAHREYFQSLATGDNFNLFIGRMLSVLLAAASRESDGLEDARLLAYECIGALGAVDPDRFEFLDGDRRNVVARNLADKDESFRLAYHLITDTLVGAFRSTGVILYQTHIAYAIQSLLQFSSLTTTRGQSLPLRARKAWEEMPKHVVDTLTPLLMSRFVSDVHAVTVPQLPIYPTQATYREWLPAWTSYLITRASGPNAQAIFKPLQAAVQSQDVSVARQVLPHIVLNILLSNHTDDVQAIRAELVAVLEDQVNQESASSKDKRLLSAQVVFMLMDHVNEWARITRQEQGTRKTESRRSRNDTDEQLVKVDSVVSSIDQSLVAKAAFECKAYARSLMSFERHVNALRQRESQARELQRCYERIHEIYANIDEPDGMAGISSIIVHPSLEHQIREHETNGQWTSAQSCWELSLRQSPDSLECHKGLLQCLRHLGHYDTLRTHVRGILLRKPEWKSALEDFQVEAAWMVNDWDEVKALLDDSPAESPETAIARVLVAMQSSDKEAIRQALSQARIVLGRPVAAAGAREYRRTYDAVLNLHLLHEFEMIQDAISCVKESTSHIVLTNLSRSLHSRFEATQPSYKVRGPILSMRRTAFGLNVARFPTLLQGEIGRSWLASAKLARKAGHMSTAYSALLQAKHHQTPYAFVQAAKLIRVTESEERALHDLEHSLSLAEESENVIDLTDEPILEDRQLLKAKAHLIRCRWMVKSDRYGDSEVSKAFTKALDMIGRYESVAFYYGKFHNDCYMYSISDSDRKSARGTKLLVATARMFLKAMRYGSKFTYQTVPRLLMIWMDIGEDLKLARSDTFMKISAELSRSIPEIPAYKWYTAFPQIASRVDHSNLEVWKDLANIIKIVIREYPQQGMWQFASVIKSKNVERSRRGREVVDHLLNEARAAGKDIVAKIIADNMTMVNELLKLCDYPIKEKNKYFMKSHFTGLFRLAPSVLIIPIQESLIASLPPTSIMNESTHQPFPVELPRFQGFKDEVDIMHSLAKPRKITIIGDDQRIYMFLGKPKDDLRKDARLMDFNALINKLLKANSESRRRKLHVRTYGVVPLNEECGFIQWVPKTTPIRPVLVKSYDERGIKAWSGELQQIFDLIKKSSDRDAGRIFRSKVLPQYPPVFHEWFIETFPEPSVWLASRLTYGRTAAVMSMVGFILGLGDRHCENILVDEVSGAAVHVDFNCLFERGKEMDTPERVPFRLTQNLVDGLGITGVEGVFRTACELTMQILRDNRDTLMTVLDAFIHDPLVEWEDKKLKLKDPISGKAADMRQVAHESLGPIMKKLAGVYVMRGDASGKERELSTAILVQTLIQEATDDCNLGKMYPGWAPWH